MSQSGKQRCGEVLRRGVFAALCTAALLLVMSAPARAQSALTQHVHQAVASRAAGFLRAMPATESLRLDVVLPLRNQAELDQFLRELYDPSSPSYRHFLTVSEFTARFGPSEEDYAALTQYAMASGFKIVGGSRDGMDLQVEGSVATIESAFHVSMGLYQHPSEDRAFYAPSREPRASLPFPLWHVSGLDNYSIPHPLFVKKSDYAQAQGVDPKSLVSHATTGSGPSASFLGSDMRAAYVGATSLTGKGQNLGLLEFGGTNLADVNTYFANIGQSSTVPITLLSVDGTSTSCLHSKRCDDTEQTLDITQAIGMAPGLASLVVYIGSSDTAILSAMTSHTPLPTTIGCSWGWTPPDPGTLDPYFQRMAAQGQNFFVASGDNSTWKASGKSEAWPADDAYVVSVGGTDLMTAGAGGTWTSETAWSDSGGGISPDNVAIPSWQQVPGVINSSSKASATYRNGPDVAANANFTFYVCADQIACTANEYGGTSFAAPMWAGYLALVNEQAASNGHATLGFINPTLYSIAASSSYSTAFHDTTSGISGSYSAVPGYDLVTGWGSPNGLTLINALAGIPTSANFTLAASPSPVSVKQGASGTSTITTTVSGGFNASIALSATGQPAGVTVTFNPASISAPGAGTSTMTMQVASTTATGSYTITVTGTGAGATHTSTVNLKVTAVPAFTIAAAPTSVSITQGKKGTSTITTAVSGGFNSAIALSASSGLPTGATAAFSPAAVAAPGSGTSILTFTVGASTAAGTYPITVSGIGGGLTRAATVSLTVAAAPPAPLALTFPAGANGKVGTPYSALLSATGGKAPYTFSISAGKLPAGLSLNTTTGAITGTPTATVSGPAANLTAKVVDSAGASATASGAITIAKGGP